MAGGLVALALVVRPSVGSVPDVAGRPGERIELDGPAAAATVDPTPVLATTGGSLSSTEVSIAGRYESAAPQRVLDSRRQAGGTLIPDRPVSLPLADRIPADAIAVVLNVTVVGAATPGYVTVWPGGTRPEVSTVNADHAGQVVANLATVPVADGGVQLVASMSTDLVVDLVGWYRLAEPRFVSAGRFVPISPRRAVDTRSGAPLGPGATMEIDVGSAGVPATASAAVLNVTVTDASGPGYWTAWPGGSRPDTSSVNVEVAGQTIANEVFVGLPSDGASSIEVFASSGGHLLVDVVGYFTGPADLPSTAGLFVPTTPYRLLDTRATGRVEGDRWLPVGASTHVEALVANLTMTDAAGPGWVSAWSGEGDWPGVSSVNTSASGQTIANHAVLPANVGRSKLRVEGATHLLVDVVGYFTDATVATYPTADQVPGADGPAPDAAQPSSVAPYV
ncbi:MAG: hypothetical protein R2705_24025 [Ilumatobacteraceae bacterium]